MSTVCGAVCSRNVLAAQLRRIYPGLTCIRCRYERGEVYLQRMSDISRIRKDGETLEVTVRETRCYTKKVALRVHGESGRRAFRAAGIRIAEC